MSGSKKLLRSAFLRKRSRIGTIERVRQSQAVLTQLSRSKLFQDAGKILAYAPLPEEVDISGIRQLCAARRKPLAFPLVCGDRMEFYEVGADDPLTEGTFHVPEPVVTEDKKPVCWEDALCLTPGIAFDGWGTRYGYGRGYYDRYFRAHPGLLRVGVAFTEQLSDQRLPAEKTDIPVQYLLTERGIARCNNAYED